MAGSDAEFMDRALELARKARGRTSPNPMVGAVLVKNGTVVGEGYHERADGPHAEVVAIENGSDATGATLYVTLEPCDHEGNTPSCTTRILAAGISRVVAAMADPNPTSRQGIARLEANGIETRLGVRREASATLNEAFLTAVREGRPFVVAKTAMTLDGKIASKTGDSRWISNERSRRFTHELRDRYDAVLVGGGTVRSDDPRLTARLDRETENPLRVVLSADLDVPLDAKLFEQSGEVVVATLRERREDSRETIDRLRDRANVEVFFVPDRDPATLLSLLADRSIRSVLLEGGAETNWSFYERGLVDKLHCVLVPKILGGREAVPAVSGEGYERIADAIAVHSVSVERFNEDILLTGYPNDAILADRREENNTRKTNHKHG